MLPLRNPQISNNWAPLLPTALAIGVTRGSYGLPLLQARLTAAAPATLAFALRIATSAGIPIIEAFATVAVGEQEILFINARPVGIDAYAHKTAAERIQIAERIWTRRAFGALHIIT